MNPNNFGTIRGNLAKAPVQFTNSDGSRTIKATVAVDRNFANRSGQYLTDMVEVEAFYPKNRDNGVFKVLEAGDNVSIAFSIRSFANPAKKQYGQSLVIESITRNESDGARADRKARTAAYKARQNAGQNPTPAAANAQAQAPAAANNPAPAAAAAGTPATAQAQAPQVAGVVGGDQPQFG